MPSDRERKGNPCPEGGELPPISPELRKTIPPHATRMPRALEALGVKPACRIPVSVRDKIASRHGSNFSLSRVRRLPHRPAAAFRFSQICESAALALVPLYHFLALAWFLA